MNILAIDTSNRTMGIAIVKEGKLAGEYITNVEKNHSVRLMPAINQLMMDTSTVPKELDKIVVAKGPGSYTGVRIGMSTAKTMGWTLNIPVIGVSSLEVVAANALLSSHYICPFFDARRCLVYTGLYKSNSDDKLESVKPETNVLFEHWLEQLAEEKRSVLFLSQDLKIHKELIMKHMADLAIFPNQNYHYPKPSALASIGAEREAEPVHQLKPNYLRVTEAEAKWLEKQQEN